MKMGNNFIGRESELESLQANQSALSLSSSARESLPVWIWREGV